MSVIISPVKTAGLLQHSRKKLKAPAEIFKGFDNLISEMYATNQSLQQEESQESSHHSIFDQALNELYINNPALLQDQEDNDEQDSLLSFNSLFKNRKTILYTLADWIPLAFFGYKLHQKFNILYIPNLEAESEPSWIQKSMQSVCPSILLNVPQHVSFFLTGAELIVQTYFIKILLKMMVFCLL